MTKIKNRNIEHRNKVYASFKSLRALRYINGVLCVNGVPASQEICDLEDARFSPMEIAALK